MPLLSQAQHIAIMGPGAIGQLVAMQLLSNTHMINNGHTNEPLVFLSSKTGASYTKRQHFIFEHYDKTLFTHDAYILHPSQLQTKHIRTLIICTKAQNTLACFTECLSKLEQDADIILLQNGLGNHEALAKLLEHVDFKGRLYLGTSTQAVKRISPYHSLHTGLGESYFGLFKDYAEYPSNETSKLAASTALPASFQYDKNIMQRLWQKLFINACINPLSVQYDCLNGALLDIPKAMDSALKICQEAAQVAKALDIFKDLDVNQITDLQYKHVKQVMHSTAENSCSMREDIKHARSTEIDFINGYIVKQAKTFNIPCPSNLALVHMIKQLEPTYKDK